MQGGAFLGSGNVFDFFFGLRLRIGVNMFRGF